MAKHTRRVLSTLALIAPVRDSEPPSLDFVDTATHCETVTGCVRVQKLFERHLQSKHQTSNIRSSEPGTTVYFVAQTSKVHDEEGLHRVPTNALNPKSPFDVYLTGVLELSKVSRRGYAPH